MRVKLVPGIRVSGKNPMPGQNAGGPSLDRDGYSLMRFMVGSVTAVTFLGAEPVPNKAGNKENGGFEAQK